MLKRKHYDNAQKLQNLPYYVYSTLECRNHDDMPDSGCPAAHVLSEIQDTHKLDFNESLNTSSFVNITYEPEQDEVVEMGVRINLADQSVYPQSFQVHNWCVNMVAKLWNCPKPENGQSQYYGGGTVGSTEACLLAGLAMKFRWRKWYMKKHNMTEEEVFRIRPSIVISTLFHSCWEKFFKYMDVEYRLISPSLHDFVIDVKKLSELVDDTTIGVVGILGNHYGGQYDPIWDIDKELTKINKHRGLQVGIHVDAASGGFTAPFQENIPPWDFRLQNVLSISASGHKYGESSCGTGWVVWRAYKDLAEHVAISVSYLGGQSESYTLNFSRPATGVYMQYYKFLRLGMEGFRIRTSRCMDVASFIRTSLQEIKVQGKQLFEFFDFCDSGLSVPIVAGRINPHRKRPYDDLDIQFAVSHYHWYVSGYHLSYEDPLTKEARPIFRDAKTTSSMFRIVVKSSLTMCLAQDLVHSIREAIGFLEEHGVGYLAVHRKMLEKAGSLKIQKRC